mmetsp:Transcript_23917/g.52240  ORF Transcript_23917/g.52240 Transcript_23917/m.52240 type:complete len:283 (-) Transcript_23917:73-921(-)|eukprot:CAMPEP_0118935410 /NCGR_PEP_ID=MMETSP1169-20130426/15628_1 /TAXON_ID=36882 /ORGANISM="Pyramimonas obovata, Strain CCMP722" /LENGTH=282 /DNA_ID=CAMNT_0006878449 /DNA_START=58 /DNA_END=906 /DNA_ORIENTATION=-
MSGGTDYLQKTLKKLREQRDEGILNAEQYRQACMKAVSSSPDLEDEEGVSTGSASTVSIVNPSLLSLDAAPPKLTTDAATTGGLTRRGGSGGGGSDFGPASPTRTIPQPDTADSSKENPISEMRSRPTGRSALDSGNASRTPAMVHLGEASFFKSKETKGSDQTTTRRHQHQQSAATKPEPPAARLPGDGHGGSAFLALAADRAEKGIVPSELAVGTPADWLKSASQPTLSSESKMSKQVWLGIAFSVLVVVLVGAALLHVSMDTANNFYGFQDPKPAALEQ